MQTPGLHFADPGSGRTYAPDIPLTSFRSDGYVWSTSQENNHNSSSYNNQTNDHKANNNNDEKNDHKGSCC